MTWTRNTLYYIDAKYTVIFILPVEYRGGRALNRIIDGFKRKIARLQAAMCTYKNTDFVIGCFAQSIEVDGPWNTMSNVNSNPEINMAFSKNPY